MFNKTKKGSIKSVTPVFILFSTPVWPDAQGLVCHCEVTGSFSVVLYQHLVNAVSRELLVMVYTIS